ncbi:MAG: phage tail tube protein [Bacilli bacterium]
MGIPKKNYTKTSIGLETTMGVAVPLTCAVPVTSVAFIEQEVTKSDTGIITGRNSSSGVSLDAINYSTKFEGNLSANKSNKLLFESLYGAKSSSVGIGSGISLVYVGTEKSCKLVITSSEIKAYVGDYKEEAMDTSFGTDGTLALADKTVSDLITALNSGNYKCRLLNGLNTSSAIVCVNPGTYQIASHYQPVFFSGTDATLTIFTPNSTYSENPTLTVQTEGTGTTEKATGGAVDSFSLSGDLKSKVKSSFSLKLLDLIANPTDANLTLDYLDEDAMKFNTGYTLINGKTWDYIKSISADFANNISDDDGISQHSLTKTKHFRGMFGITGSMTVTTTDKDDDLSSELEREKVASDLESSLQLEYVGTNITDDVKSQIIFDFRSIQYTSSSKSAQDTTIDTSLDFQVADLDNYGDYTTLYFIGE